MMKRGLSQHARIAEHSKVNWINSPHQYTKEGKNHMLIPRDAENHLTEFSIYSQKKTSQGVNNRMEILKTKEEHLQKTC